MFSIIVDIIGIIGFIISAINVWYFFSSNRKKLYFRFGNYASIKWTKDKELLIIHLNISNLSQLPISITRMQISINDSLYESEYRPYIAEEFTWSNGTEPYHSVIIESKVLPINIASLGAESGYLAFEVPQGMISNSETALNFRICTNRGKAVQKTFSLHEDVRL